MSRDRTETEKLQHTINRDALLAAWYLGDKLDRANALQAQQNELQAQQNYLLWYRGLSAAARAAEDARVEGVRQAEIAEQARQARGRRDAEIERLARQVSRGGLPRLVWWLSFFCVLGWIVYVIAYAATINGKTHQAGPAWDAVLAYSVIAALLYVRVIVRANRRQARRRERLDALRAEQATEQREAQATETDAVARVSAYFERLTDDQVRLLGRMLLAEARTLDQAQLDQLDASEITPEDLATVQIVLLVRCSGKGGEIVSAAENALLRTLRYRVTNSATSISAHRLLLLIWAKCVATSGEAEPPVQRLLNGQADPVAAGRLLPPPVPQPSGTP